MTLLLYKSLLAIKDQSMLMVTEPFVISSFWYDCCGVESRLEPRLICSSPSNS